jgi:hypothetical protein
MRCVLHPGIALLGYFVAVFLGGALLTRWLYRGAQGAAELIPAFQPLAAHPFSRYLSRALLLAALLGLWPLLRAVGMRSWQGVGLSQPARQVRRLAAGALIGSGMILGVCYQRTGSLFLPVGLHAGWIVGLKLGGFMTRAAVDSPGAFWGSGRILDGWLAFLALGLLLAFCLCFPGLGPRTDGAPWERNLQTG